jgi:hypothetical protein
VAPHTQSGEHLGGVGRPVGIWVSWPGASVVDVAGGADAARMDWTGDHDNAGTATTVEVIEVW